MRKCKLLFGEEGRRRKRRFSGPVLDHEQARSKSAPQAVMPNEAVELAITILSCFFLVATFAVVWYHYKCYHLPRRAKKLIHRTEESGWEPDNRIATSTAV